jgi:hypothetical protein
LYPKDLDYFYVAKWTPIVCAWKTKLCNDATKREPRSQLEFIFY